MKRLTYLLTYLLVISLTWHTTIASNRPQGRTRIRKEKLGFSLFVKTVALRVDFVRSSSESSLFVSAAPLFVSSSLALRLFVSQVPLFVIQMALSASLRHCAPPAAHAGPQVAWFGSDRRNHGPRLPRSFSRHAAKVTFTSRCLCPYWSLRCSMRACFTALVQECKIVRAMPAVEVLLEVAAVGSGESGMSSSCGIGRCC